MKYSEIEEAFLFVSSGGLGENEAYIDIENEKIYWHSEYECFDELPDDIAEKKYLLAPHKNELGLGKPLVMNFIYEYSPKDLEEIHSIFSRKGAYAKFKSFLKINNLLDEWYSYEARNTKDAIRQWCSENGVELSG